MRAIWFILLDKTGKYDEILFFFLTNKAFLMIRMQS